MMLTFTKLRQHNIARQKEWDQGIPFTTLYYSNALAGEVGEACNIVKKIERQEAGVVGSTATNAMLAEELADVIIYCDLLAKSAGIDLESAVVNKFNATSEKYGLSVKMEP